MTHKLYWQDPYRTQFTARVVARVEEDHRPGVILNRTCFYPTSGGQPHDTGVLAQIPVVDVTEDPGVVQQALPITARLYPLEEAIRLPLRKPPRVSGPVRVVEIQGVDWSACGGTHVRQTSEIGHVVITRLERRGDQTRVHFLAGGRAARDHRQRIHVTQQLTAQLSTHLQDLPQAITRLQAQVKESHRAVRQARELLTRAEAQRLIAEAPRTGGVDVVYHLLEPDTMWSMEELMKALISFPSVVALMGAMEKGRARWMAGRSANVPMDMLENLSELKETFDVQGGGAPDLIQGVAPDFDTLEKALHLLQAFAFDLPDLV